MFQIAMSKFISLADKISTDQVECLNEDAEHPARNIFTSDPARYLQSDVDPQLLVSVPFQVPVKIGSIKISFREGIDEKSIPSSVKLFTNRVSLGFGDAEALVPIQTIGKDALRSGNEIPLRYVLFQNVQSIQLFFEDNGGAETTEIGEVEFFGIEAEKMDMKDFKKINDDE